MNMLANAYLVSAASILGMKHEPQTLLSPRDIARRINNSTLSDHAKASAWEMLALYYRSLYESSLELSNSSSVARDCIMAEYNAKKGSAA